MEAPFARLMWNFGFQDLVQILPMMDQTVVLEVDGRRLLACLENGVSQFPALEGRFLQVSDR